MLTPLLNFIAYNRIIKRDGSHSKKKITQTNQYDSANNGIPKILSLASNLLLLLDFATFL